MPLDPRIAEILRKRREQAIVIEQTVQRQIAPGSAQTTTETIPLDNSELAERLAEILPAADALIRSAILALRSDGRLTWLEALTLAPEVRNIVSEVVGKLVPEIKGASARELVILVLAQLLQQYLAPYLPALVRGWLTAQTLRTLIDGLQLAYATWVKPKLQKGGVLPQH